VRQSIRPPVFTRLRRGQQAGHSTGATSAFIRFRRDKPDCCCALSAAAGVCRDLIFQRQDTKIWKVFSGALALKTNTRTPCDARVNKNWSAQSSGNHAKDSRHEFTTEKIHPSALPVTKGHAPEAVTLDLHRQAKNRQWPVFVFFEFLNFVLHATTYAGIKESAHFISIYISRRMWGN
jgi:hypothetical protein